MQVLVGAGRAAIPGIIGEVEQKARPEIVGPPIVGQNFAGKNDLITNQWREGWRRRQGPAASGEAKALTADEKKQLEKLLSGD